MTDQELLDECFIDCDDESLQQYGLNLTHVTNDKQGVLSQTIQIETNRVIFEREKKMKRARRVERNKKFRGVFTRYRVGYLLPGISNREIIEAIKSAKALEQTKKKSNDSKIKIKPIKPEGEIEINFSEQILAP